MRVATEIVNTDGPIHYETLKKVIRDSFHVSNGQKIDATLNAVMRSVVNSNKVSRDGPFLIPRDQRKYKLRIPGEHGEKRKIDEIPTGEIELAILEVTANSISISKEDLPKEVAKLFGIPARRETKQLISKVVRDLASAKKILWNKRTSRYYLPSKPFRKKYRAPRDWNKIEYVPDEPPVQKAIEPERISHQTNQTATQPTTNLKVNEKPTDKGKDSSNKTKPPAPKTKKIFIWVGSLALISMICGGLLLISSILKAYSGIEPTPTHTWLAQTSTFTTQPTQASLGIVTRTYTPTPDNTCMFWADLTQENFEETDCVFGQIIELRQNPIGDGEYEYVIRFIDVSIDPLDHFLYKGKILPDSSEEKALEVGECIELIGEIYFRNPLFFMTQDRGDLITIKHNSSLCQN